MFPQEETPAFPLPPCNWLSPPHVVTSLGLIIHAAVPPLLEKPFRYNISFEFRGANNSDPRCCCKERQLLLDETTHSSVYVCESKLFKCAEYIWHHTPVVFKKKRKLLARESSVDKRSGLVCTRRCLMRKVFLDGLHVIPFYRSRKVVGLHHLGYQGNRENRLAWWCVHIDSWLPIQASICHHTPEKKRIGHKKHIYFDRSIDRKRYKYILVVIHANRLPRSFVLHLFLIQ